MVDGRHAEVLRERLELAHAPAAERPRARRTCRGRTSAARRCSLARAWIEASERCLVVRGDRPLDVESLRLLVAARPRAGAEHDAAIVVANAPDADPAPTFRVKLAPEADTDLHTVARARRGPRRLRRRVHRPRARQPHDPRRARAAAEPDPRARPARAGAARPRDRACRQLVAVGRAAPRSTSRTRSPRSSTPSGTRTTRCSTRARSTRPPRSRARSSTTTSATATRRSAS